VVNRVPHNLTLETNAVGASRLYFLSVPSGLRENTILYVDNDCSAAVQSDSNKVLEWYQLLDSFQSNAVSSSGQMSREEQLLRERKRLRSYGITGYDYVQYGEVGHFAFCAANSVFVCSDPFNNEVKPVSIL
jgi:dipeptidyl-peptidase 9